MKFALLFMASILSAFATNGCQHSCTEVGCESGVTVVLTKLAQIHASKLPIALHACLDDGSCVDATVTASACTSVGMADCTVAADGSLEISIYMKAEPASGDGHTVHVTLEDNAGTAFFDATQPVSMKSFEPNGPDCEPTCYQGTTTLAP